MNRKGFTLVELLVVIIILLAIMVIALPSINKILDKSKENDNGKVKELIESSALIYANDNNITTSQYIPLSTLLEEGYITKKEKDSCGDNSFVTCSISACTLTCN